MGIAPNNPAPFPGSSWTNLSSTVKPPPSFTDPTPIGPYPVDLPRGGTIQPEPPPGNSNIGDYVQRLLAYLNTQRARLQGQYRGLGNTATSWYDWAFGQSQRGVADWIAQNWIRPPSPGPEDTYDPYPAVRERWAEGEKTLNAAFQEWLRQNSVNYTNPVQMPMPGRMTLPVTDWTRLAGPGYGIASGFAERATKSPWAADYRGGAFGPTARTPSWTVPPPSGGLRPQI